jgi:hypothetical protein
VFLIAASHCWATADTLHAVAAALGSRVLRQAADSYDRAARSAYGRTPRPTPAGNSLRQAGRLLARAAAVSGDYTLAQVALITQLAVLAEAVISLRHAQRHAAQAGLTLNEGPAALDGHDESGVAQDLDGASDGTACHAELLDEGCLTGQRHVGGQLPGLDLRAEDGSELLVGRDRRAHVDAAGGHAAMTHRVHDVPNERYVQHVLDVLYKLN